MVTEIQEGTSQAWWFGYPEAADLSFTYTLKTAAGTATPGSDFVTLNLSGSGTGYIDVTIATIDDTIVEKDETFSVVFSAVDEYGNASQFVADFVIKDDDKLSCQLDYNGDGVMDKVELSLSQGMALKRQIDSKLELAKVQVQSIQDRMDAIQDQIKYARDAEAARLVKTAAETVLAGLAIAVEAPVAATIVTVTSFVSAAVETITDPGSGDGAKDGVIAAAVFAEEQLSERALKIMPVVELARNITNTVSDAEESAKEILALQNDWSDLNGYLADEQARVRAFEAAQAAITKCLGEADLFNGPVTNLPLMFSSEAVSTDYVPVPFLHVPSTHTFVAQGTAAAEIFDARHLPSDAAVAMVAPGAGDDKILVSGGGVYIDDTGGTDVVEVFNSDGKLLHVSDVSVLPVNSLQDAFSIYTHDSEVQARGVEYIDLLEGRFAFVDGNLVRQNYVGVTTDADDTFWSGKGPDNIDGAGGSDQVIFSGNRADYNVAIVNGALVVTDRRAGSPDGTDTLHNVEHLVFQDREYNLTIAAKAASIAPDALNSLIDLYVAYFNRVPEASGLSYWIDQYNGGKSLATIAGEFYQAGIQFSSVTGYSADMPLQDFVKVLYTNVLDRTGAHTETQAEIDYWVNQVNTHQVERDGLVARFLHDARQFYGDPDVGYVPLLLDQKDALGKLHAVTDGIDYHDNDTAITTGMALAAAVTPEGYQAAVNMIGLAADTHL